MTPMLATPPPPRKASRRDQAAPTPQAVPDIVALEGGKGGTGKSVIACCLAFAALGHRRRVLLLDADPRASSRIWASVATEDPKQPVLDGPSAASEAADRTGALIVVLAAGDNLHQHIHGLAAQVRADLVLIDCPGSVDKVQRASLAVADLVLIPCGPDPTDLWVLSKSADLVLEAMRHRPELRAAVLLNKLRDGQALTANARAQAPGVGLPVMNTELGFRTAYPMAIANGRGPIASMRREDKAAAEVAALYREVMRLLRRRDLAEANSLSRRNG